MLVAHLKRILKLDRLRLRGMNCARDEFLLAATARNLRRMAKLLSQLPPIQGPIKPSTHHPGRMMEVNKKKHTLPQYTK